MRFLIYLIVLVDLLNMQRLVVNQPPHPRKPNLTSLVFPRMGEQSNYIAFHVLKIPLLFGVHLMI